MPSFTIISNVTANGNTVTNSKTYTAGGGSSISTLILDAAEDDEIVITIDISQIKGLYMVADVAMTVDTNITAGTDTIVLVANVPYVETEDTYHVPLLTVDVTKLFLTNASGSDGTFKLEVVYDETP